MLKHLTSAYAVGVMSRILGQIIAFATVMVASRFLNLAEFGTFALAWAAAVIANSFVFTGFYQALLRSPDPEADRDTFFWLIFGVGAFSTVVIGSVGFMVGGLATQAGLAFCALAPIPILMSPVAWNEALLVSAKRVRSASSYIVLSESFGLIVAYFCLKAGYGLFSLIAARYAMVIVSIVVTGALVRNWPQLRLNRKTVRECKTTVPPLWGTTAMGMFSNYGTDIILGAFLNPVAVGAYRGGSRIAVTISDMVLQPMAMLSWSRFTRLEKENRPDLLSEAWMENVTLAAALVWPALLAVALLSPELVSVVFDETWLPAAPVLTLLSLSRAARFFSTLLEPTMICCGKPRVPLKIRFIGVVLLLASLLIFGHLSVEAAAMAHLSTSVVVGVLSIIATIAVLDLSRRDLMVTYLPGLMLAGVFGVVILATSQMRAEMEPTAGLVATVGMLAVIWLVAMVLGIRRKILVFPKP